MIRNFNWSGRIWLLAAGFRLISLPAVAAVDSDAAAKTVPPTPSHIDAPFRVTPGPADGQIAFLTARLLENWHYSHAPFNSSVSSQFLDRYLESLDPQHLHFVQSDLARFESYRTNLNTLTLSRRGLADTSPAYEIFDCFVQRLQQRVAYADELLKNEKFEFNADERMTIDRRESAWPKDLNEAHALWRQRLRFEYLLEKLGLDAGKTKPALTNATGKTGPVKTASEQIVETLGHRYHRTLRMFTDWNNEDVMGIYLTALTHVYDPHSDYFNREQLDGFKISMNLELFGIGAELRSVDGYCRIERLLPGGPALKSKTIEPGDRIVAVAQSNQPPVDVVEMSLSKAVQLIRGPKGTVVRLTLLPANSAEQKVISLVRDEIPLEDQAAKGKIIESLNTRGTPVRLGVIKLPSFYAPMDPGNPRPAAEAKGGSSGYTSVDVARLLNKFKQENINGVILDLRDNGGGSLEEAIKLTGLFIKEGPVVQVLDSDGARQVDKDTDPSVAYSGPLIVLTSRFSASASEIVAGALQDYDRALIVGDAATHGKGTVQTVTSLRQIMRLSESDPYEPGALKFTIRKFYRASGASTQLKGVLPDIVLPSRWNYSKDVGESSLENPLPWDTISSAQYEKVNIVRPYLSELLKRSAERVATNQDFVYVREDIEEFRKQQADKTVSLNEKQRVKEKEEAEARQKARDKELRARKESNEKVYEITLKQAELPGLPLPVQKTNSLAAKLTPDAAAWGEIALKQTATVSNQTSGGDVALSGTNSLAGPFAANASGLNDDDGDREDRPAAVDVDLNEAERILMDYLSLLPKGSPLLATQQDGKSS